jgi:DNA-binding response OmpR family regulator
MLQFVKHYRTARQLGYLARVSTQAPYLLLVEDDVRLAQLTAEYLTDHGALVTHVTSGDAALREAARCPYELVILDLMLPGRDGLTVCRALRERSGVPVIIVTARTDEVDRVLGLETGADDYLTKPFSARELWARIQAVLRRTHGSVGPSETLVRIGPLAIDAARRRVELDGRELLLTTYEFALLYALALRAGRVLSRENLIDLVRGSADEAFERSVDVHISRLRQKLGDDPRQPRWVKTVRGVGYVLADESAAST